MSFFIPKISFNTLMARIHHDELMEERRRGRERTEANRQAALWIQDRLPVDPYMKRVPARQKRSFKKSSLTLEQRERIAKNRKRALAIKALNKLKAAFRGQRLRKFLFSS